MELFSIPSAAGIIVKKVENENYVLIQERWKLGTESENGLIEIPGGKVREYENVYNCLRREIKEETGLRVIEIDGECDSTILETNGYKVLNYMPFSCSQNIAGTYPIMVEVFICKVDGEIIKETDESKNIHWISLYELNKLLNENNDKIFPMHNAVLKKYLNVKGFE